MAQNRLPQVAQLLLISIGIENGPADRVPRNLAFIKINGELYVNPALASALDIADHATQWVSGPPVFYPSPAPGPPKRAELSSIIFDAYSNV